MVAAAQVAAAAGEEAPTVAAAAQVAAAAEEEAPTFGGAGEQDAPTFGGAGEEEDDDVEATAIRMGGELLATKRVVEAAHEQAVSQARAEAESLLEGARLASEEAKQREEEAKETQLISGGEPSCEWVLVARCA